ncbi:unnamed protein product [Cylicocyclus nassatus]|uniref:Transmembrane protein n=1 Tax=Cylicocyclus nassatus TaxID=53992 RepID=A0AA36M3C7_CYLNA|nr:unnamed protein product [Cylicocyclus nassatus]
MYDEEPRALCNLPLSGTVGIMSSLVLLSQVLALFLVCSNNFFIYFFELLIAFGMVFFLSQGVRRKKPSHLTIYMAYLAIYVFMMFFIIFGILIGLSFYPSIRRECEKYSTTSPYAAATTVESDVTGTTTRGNRVPTFKPYTPCTPFPKAFWAEVWSSVALSILSIFLSAIQLRYTLILYKYMRTRQRQERANLNVSYQHYVPGAPPRYTPESPYTIENAPAQVDAGPLPPKPPIDGNVSTLQAASLANGPSGPPPVAQSGSKDTMPGSFLRVESPPEYSEVPGPSERSLPTQQTSQQTAPQTDQNRLDDVPLNDGRTPRVDLLS